MNGAEGFEEVTLRCSPSYSERGVGGIGRFGSWARRERCRVRGLRDGLPASADGGWREVLEALREGGPTKRAGAGRRLVTVFFRGSEDIVPEKSDIIQKLLKVTYLL